MTDQPQFDLAPQRAELHRLIRLRWAAVAAIAVATVGNGVLDAFGQVHVLVLAAAAAVAAYNAILRLVLARARTSNALALLVHGQLLADLVVLTLLVCWTGGWASPVLLAFPLHMILSSQLLAPRVAYLAPAVAALLVAAGVGVVGGWPTERAEIITGLAWFLLLLLTVYLTNHITGGLRASAAALRRQSSRTQAILTTAADGIITIDERGIIHSANPAAERILGYGADEMIGRNVGMLMPEPYSAKHDGFIKDYLESGVAKIIGIGRELVAQHKDGRVVPIDLAVSEVKLGDSRLFTGIIRDITDRKQAEAELRKLHEELLNHQAALAQHEKMAAMGQMAAGMAHEIANPLASMDSLLQLVERHPERLKGDTVNGLREQVARINRLVRGMTEFAHPLETTWEVLPANYLVERAVESLRFDRRFRRVSLRSVLDPEAGEVRVMPDAIHQVIVNLVLNALDATAGVDEPTITIATHREPDGCRIEVTDNGCGIKPEHASRVFEPFFTTKPVGQGTGLGLSISYGLIERHKGRFELESEPGRGTTFSIRLPGSCVRESGDGADS